MEDTGIVALYWSRDQSAITASEEKYGPLCRGLSYRILTSWEDAEECTNDTWQRAWDTMPPQKPDSLRAYLCRIVRNLSLDRWRAARARKRGEGAAELSLELEDCLPHAPSAEEETEARALTAALEGWLDGLDRSDRALFLLRYWYGQRVDELAVRWHWTPNRTAQRLRRLRLALKAYLEGEGIVV